MIRETSFLVGRILDHLDAMCGAVPSSPTSSSSSFPAPSNLTLETFLPPGKTSADRA